MTRSLIIKLLLLVAAGMLAVWVARNTYWDEATVPLPPRGEAARNPFYAAQRLAEELGARTSWERYLATPPTGSTLVVSYWHWDLVAGRRERLERWVEAGGHLVVDTSFVGGEEAFAEWSGIAHTDLREQSAGQGENPLSGARRPRRERCQNMVVLGDGTSSTPSGSAQLKLCDFPAQDVLTTTRRVAWGVRDEQGHQAVRVNVGKGTVTVINATPFLERQLFEGDHAALFAAATQLSRASEIRFVSENEHSSLLSLMWMFGAPAVALALVLIALALWRGSVRFGPLTAEPERARRSLAEQIRGTGQFVLRVGKGKALHAAAVRALGEAALRRVASYTSLPAEERIAVLEKLTGLSAEELRSAIHYSGSRRTHDLRNALALIESARRRILIERRSMHGNRIEHPVTRG